MFRNDPCAVAGCEQYAFGGSPCCFFHQDDKEAAVAKALKEVREGHTVIDLALSGIELSGRDFSRAKFVCCSFEGAQAAHCLFTGAIFRLCVFDRAAFSACDFSGVDMDFCSMGQANILDCSFENSELIHVNFDGACIMESTFSGSNLYDSRFLMCSISNSSFDNCDFKRAYFIPKKAECVSMKNSNTMEAVREFGEFYR